MIAAKRMNNWARHYAEEVKASIIYHNFMNMCQPVWTRQMTEREKNEIFGNNPDYIKTIGRKTDGQEWRLLDFNEYC